MSTTAKMREKARLYESRADWHMAALCWQDALTLYPVNQIGAMADKDRAELAKRAASCKAAAKAELIDHCLAVCK